MNPLILFTSFVIHQYFQKQTVPECITSCTVCLHANLHASVPVFS